MKNLFNKKRFCILLSALLISNCLTQLPPKKANATWTVVDYSIMTDDDLSEEDRALMHEDNWLNNYVAERRGKTFDTLTLADFLGVKRLDYSSSKITTIPNSIKFMSNLDYIYLYNNHLTTLPPEIGNLTKLTTVYLLNSTLTTLPPEIGNLTNLDYLYIDSTLLTSLPPEIGNLTKLTILYLKNNQLKTLPPEIGNLTKLTNLTLTKNKITTIPPEIGNLTNLKTLTLDQNQITTLLPEIGNLTTLTTLNLASNQITTLPPEIGNLTTLTTLYLNNNRITTIPPEIGNLTTLTTLYLNNNSITTIPPEIGNLTTLTTLYLNNNSITTIPPEIGNLTKLTNLTLTKNQITTIPPEIGNLTNLKTLTLDQNQITTIPPEIGNLTNLTNLYLNNNRLTSILPEIGNLTTLTTLNLASNQITTLPSTINNLTKLTNSSFNLANNYFTSKLVNFPKANYSNNFINVVSPHSDLDFLNNSPIVLNLGTSLNVSSLINKYYNSFMPQPVVAQLQLVVDDPTIIDSTGKAIAYGTTNIRVQFPNNPSDNPSGITQTSIQVTVPSPDTVGPTTPTVTLDNTSNPTNSNVGFTVGGSTDDISGVKNYQYIVDPSYTDGRYTGTWQDYSTIVTVSTEGNHLVAVRAVDNAGNYSSIATKQFTIDKTAPVINLTQTLAESKIDSTINYSITEDNFSSVVLPDGTTSTSKTGTFKASENGTYSFNCTDTAGNVTTKTIDVTEISSVQCSLSTNEIDFVTADVLGSPEPTVGSLDYSVTSSAPYVVKTKAVTSFANTEDPSLVIPITALGVKVNGGETIYYTGMTDTITLATRMGSIDPSVYNLDFVVNPSEFYGLKAGVYKSVVQIIAEQQ